MFKGKKNILIISAVAGAAVAGLGIGMAVYFANKNKKSDGGSTPASKKCGINDLKGMKINDTPVVSTASGGSVAIDETARTVSITIPNITLNIEKDGDIIMSTVIPDCVVPTAEYTQILDAAKIDVSIVKSGQACVVAKIVPEKENKTRLYFYLSLNDEAGMQDTTGKEGFAAGPVSFITPIIVKWTY